MNLSDLNDVSPAARLAIGSALPKDAGVYRALFTLDGRLERAVREASEPIVAQLKLAWWRDRFAASPEAWPKGEPLLEELASWGSHSAKLGELVNGWEILTGDAALSASQVDAFAQSRTIAWSALSDVVLEGGLTGEQQDALKAAATASALGDLQERGVDISAAAITISVPTSLPRRLRPFSVLGVLGRRAIVKQRPVLDGMPALALAMRHGLLGR